MLPRIGLAALAVLALALAAAPAQAAPEVFAHRGGAYINGKPTFPENTLPAFGLAALQGDPLEFDIKLTSDGVPVVMHDATLDRTTNCTGRVVDKTAAQLRSCGVDVLGVPGSDLPTSKGPSTPARIPTLEDILALARRTGATIVPEIKNYPTDPDYDATPAFATKVTDGLAAGGVLPSKTIVQSFTTENLDVVQQRLPAVQTSLLALQSGNQAAIPLAIARNYTWVSPEWPVDGAYVGAAHAGGRKVVPFTIDTADQMVAAGGTGVDAEITNDPTRAHGALGVPFPKEDPPVASSTSSKASVKKGVASVKVRCNSIAAQTCVGNLALKVSGHGTAGSAQFAIAGGKAQTIKVNVKSGTKGDGSATVSTYDERGKPASARSSITLA